MVKTHIKLEPEEIEKIKFFVQATVKVLEVFDIMLEDERIDQEIRNEYQERILQ
jgi:hypothetical protein